MVQIDEPSKGARSRHSEEQQAQTTKIELSKSHIADHQYPNKPRTNPVAIYSAIDDTWLARLEHRPIDLQTRKFPAAELCILQYPVDGADKAVSSQLRHCGVPTQPFRGLLCNIVVLYIQYSSRRALSVIQPHSPSLAMLYIHYELFVSVFSVFPR